MCVREFVTVNISVAWELRHNQRRSYVAGARATRSTYIEEWRVHCTAGHIYKRRRKMFTKMSGENMLLALQATGGGICSL